MRAWFFSATLYNKLALALFLTLLGVGLGMFMLVRYTTVRYQQEVSQQLNASLAAHIVTQTELFKFGKVNHQALQEIFHMMMAINPTIEVYLVGAEGEILADAAPEHKIQRHRLNMAPLLEFLRGSGVYPLFGDDPRALANQKIFSAAEVNINQNEKAYLYVILGGEEYDSVAALLQGGYAQRLAGWALAGSLIVALLFGWLLFFFLTRRLVLLSHKMDSYAELQVTPDAREDCAIRFSAKAKPGDEIERLGRSFNTMADRIDSQLQTLRGTDAKRRELIASVSHDLRTPLASMMGYLETLLLKDSEYPTEARRRYLQIAYRHCQDLAKLVAELFELARLESVETLLNIEPFSLAELVQDVAQKFRLAVSKRNIVLHTELGKQASFAYGDIGLIQRVLENLLENALRHTPPQGRITLSLIPGRDKITVGISDTGCGIAARDLPHVFDRFYRAQQHRGDSKQHAGLGLAIAKHIVSLHGGTISASSTEQRGTTVSFSIPAHAP
ncbi:MAG: HAMP domain-containing histidine kinase [Gammaproteobacteria bacterium]|nr:HAMP domain-containing histidine kinase [Gammaproteobacteria bacterium]